MPDRRGGVQRFGRLGLGAAAQLLQLPGQPVALIEQLALRQQVAFLGEQQEHHAHHHGDSCRVDLVSVVRQRVWFAAASGILGRFRERLHDQLDRSADLAAQ